MRQNSVRAYITFTDRTRAQPREVWPLTDRRLRAERARARPRMFIAPVLPLSGCSSLLMSPAMTLRHILEAPWGELARQQVNAAGGLGGTLL